MEANLLQIKAAGLLNLPCHLDVGVCLAVICYDYREALTYISSLCDISDVCSYITFLPNTSVEPLSEKKQRGTAIPANTVLSYYKNPNCFLS